MTVRLLNPQCEWRIADNGTNLAFIDCKSGRDCLMHAPASPCAYVMKCHWRADATAASFSDGILHLAFGDAGTAEIQVDSFNGYFVFTILSAEGDFDRLAFINIPTILEAVPDKDFSACTIALSLKSNVEELPGPQCHLWSQAYREIGFEGAQTGLVTSSFAEMREHMKEMVSNAPQVPHSPLCGPWALDSRLPCYSNVMEAPTLEDADQWIDFCKRLGLKAIEFNGPLDYGTYLPNPVRFPNGFKDVRTLIDKMHAAGILAGLHTMSFSINKHCQWVTPKPDPRLAKERSYTLAVDITADDDTVPLADESCDLPPFINYYVRRSMTLQIDDELIEYSTVTADKPFSALKCRRGACGTVAAPHAAGAKVHHLKECWGCFAPDGESTLFQEVADKISDAVNECGFDFVYLDGLDGAHIIGGEELRWYYGAKFTFDVFRGLKHPIMMEMATFHHHLWYVRTRMQAWDHNKRDHKVVTDLHVFSNSFARRMFMPMNLGWLGLFPWCDHQTDPTYWDDIEYIWSKALATDADLILQCVTPQSLQAGAWLSDLAPIIRTYERLRLERHFPEAIRNRLAKPGQEFRLCPLGDDKWAFQPIQSERHQVDDVEGLSNVWSFKNKYAANPVALRIQAFPSIAPYDSPDAIALNGFTDDTEFKDPGDTITILNSGKLYTYPSKAPGMSISFEPGAEDADGPGKACARFSAARVHSDELIPGSGPGDHFSLFDHFEREYKLREGAWASLQCDFDATKDLSANQGLGVWIKGDGKGELIDLVLLTKTYSLSRGEFFIPINFTGWRYIELLNTTTTDFEKHSWPFARCHYDIYRHTIGYAKTVGMQLWFNDVPRDDSVSCLLSPVHALPLVSQPVLNPTLNINGRDIMFPVSMTAGQYLEYYGTGNARLYNGNGDFISEAAPQCGDVPVLAEGNNDIAFSCAGAALRPHLRVTLFTRASELFGDENSARDIPWGKGPLAADPDFGTRALAVTPPTASNDNFIAP